jgi:hypothetical protein
MKARAAYKTAKKDGRIEGREGERIVYFIHEAMRELAAMEQDVLAEVR